MILGEGGIGNGGGVGGYGRQEGWRRNVAGHIIFKI